MGLAWVSAGLGAGVDALRVLRQVGGRGVGYLALRRGVAQPGSARRSGRRGPRFESGRPDWLEFCEGQRTRAKIRSNTGFRGRSFARVRGCSVVGGMQTGRRSRPNGTQTGRKAVSSLSPVAPPRADIPPALQRSTLGLSRAAIGSRTGALGMRITPTLTRRWASVWRLCRRRCAPRSTGAPPAPCGRSACAPDRDTT